MTSASSNSGNQRSAPSASERRGNSEAQPPVSGLRWSVKLSFLNYVSHLPDGRAALGPGVKAIDDQAMVFLAAAATHAAAENGDLIIRFTGEVRFGGHRGLLFVRLAEPWLHLGDDGGEMSVADPFLKDETARIPVVSFTVPSSTPWVPGWSADDVRLTEAGAGIFNDVYAVGEPFEPFTVI